MTEYLILCCVTRGWVTDGYAAMVERLSGGENRRKLKENTFQYFHHESHMKSLGMEPEPAL
jgi:hypothetical protein